MLQLHLQYSSPVHALHPQSREQTLIAMQDMQFLMNKPSWRGHRNLTVEVTSET